MDLNRTEFEPLFHKGEWDVDARLEHQSNVFFADQYSSNAWKELPIFKLPIEEQFDVMRQRFDICVKELVESIQPFHKDLEAVTAHIFLWGAAKASKGFCSYLNREQEKIRTAAFYKTRRVVEADRALDMLRSNQDSTLDMLRSHRDSILDCQNRINTLITAIQNLQAELRCTSRAASLGVDGQWLTACNIQNDLKFSLNIINDICQNLDRMITDAFTDLQLELTNTQIQESRKSIEQNATVKRLTALAFIFIPLSTIASIFGMNIPEISPSPLWKFLVTSATVVTAVVFIALFESLVRLSRRVICSFQHTRIRRRPSMKW